MQYIVRVDSDPPLFFGPFTKDESEQASAELQDKYETETGTYMLCPTVESSIDKAVEFNDPNYQGD